MIKDLERLKQDRAEEKDKQAKAVQMEQFRHVLNVCRLDKDDMDKSKACNIASVRDLLAASNKIEDFNRRMTPGDFNDEISDKLWVSDQLISQDPNSDILKSLTKELVEEKMMTLKPRPPKQGTVASDMTTREDAVALHQNLKDILKSNDIPSSIRSTLHETLHGFLRQVHRHHCRLQHDLKKIKSDYGQSKIIINIEDTMKGFRH